MRLQQILLNLLSNAIKFSSGGKVSIWVVCEGNTTRFEITDSGIGMSEEVKSRLFRPFEQADSSTTRNYGGTGLGLAISHNLARLMGGDIEVESPAGIGSVFTLLLPLSKSEPVHEVEMVVPVSSGYGLEGLRILAVEDIELNRMLLDELLSAAGASVEFAENGKQAVERLQDGKAAVNYDVILMDVQMPVMDGYEASHRIQKIAPGLPIIGLTAHALAEERNKCLASGMVAHVTKPIDIDILIREIATHVTAPSPVYAVNSRKRRSL